MKHYILITWALLAATVCLAQKDEPKEIFAFRITDYIVKLSDSTVAVQLELSKGNVGIAEKQVAILKGNYSNGDTGLIGTGRCSLIKGTYYYFTILLKDKNRQPKKNDLVFTRGIYPVTYKGQIYKLIQQDIYLSNVYNESFYSFAFPVLGDKFQEERLIDSLVADIKLTAREMQQQDNGMDRMITTGRFRDKKLFTAMQQVKNIDVIDFLDYMIVRPKNYSGNEWKISEVFATWMVSSTPTVIKN